jgi:hypothetical protein
VFDWGGGGRGEGERYGRPGQQNEQFKCFSYYVRADLNKYAFFLRTHFLNVHLQMVQYTPNPFSLTHMYITTYEQKSPALSDGTLGRIHYA